MRRRARWLRRFDYGTERLRRILKRRQVAEQRQQNPELGLRTRRDPVLSRRRALQTADAIVALYWEGRSFWEAFYEAKEMRGKAPTWRPS